MSYFQYGVCFEWNILLRQEIERLCRLDKALTPPSGKVHHPGVGVKRLVRATDWALYVHIITVCSPDERSDYGKFTALSFPTDVKKPILTDGLFYLSLIHISEPTRP